MKTLLPLALIAVVMSFTGCASIVSGSTQTVGFHSNPEGADVSVDGRTVGRTPVAVELKRKDGQNVTFSKDGYKPVTMAMTTKTNGWFWGNILIGGFPGSTTDSVSGAIDEYAPNEYMATLEAEAAGNMEAQTTLGPAQKAREFIVVGYRSLAQDIRAGQGQYLDSLLDMLSVAKEDRQAASKRLGGFLEAYPDIPDFADHVIDAYLTAQPAAATTAALAPPQGEWATLRDDGSLNELYRYLTSDDFADAQSKAATLRESRRAELTDFLLDNTGHKSLMSWEFHMNANLSNNERQFVSWYLTTYTSYKPGL